jgi:hypothetical protein
MALRAAEKLSPGELDQFRSETVDDVVLSAEPVSAMTIRSNSLPDAGVGEALGSSSRTIASETRRSRAGRDRRRCGLRG